MKGNESKFVFSIIAAVVVSLLAGCASFPFDEVRVEVFDDFFVDSKTYNGGE